MFYTFTYFISDRWVVRRLYYDRDIYHTPATYVAPTHTEIFGLNFEPLKLLQLIEYFTNDELDTCTPKSCRMRFTPIYNPKRSLHIKSPNTWLGRRQNKSTINPYYIGHQWIYDIIIINTDMRFAFKFLEKIACGHAYNGYTLW